MYSVCGHSNAIATLSNGRIIEENGRVRFEVFTAITMKNAVFWDIKFQFVPHRRHITSPLQNLAS
jgi:hypothetical protein